MPAVRPRKLLCSCARFLLWQFGKEDPSKRRRGANGGADVKPIPALSQVGIIGRFHVLYMTQQLLALSSFRYYQPIPIERGLNGDMSMTITEMIHPSQDPDALVVVTHDSEWMTLIKTVRHRNLEYISFFYLSSRENSPQSS